MSMEGRVHTQNDSRRIRVFVVLRCKFGPCILLFAEDPCDVLVVRCMIPLWSPGCVGRPGRRGCGPSWCFFTVSGIDTGVTCAYGDCLVLESKPNNGDLSVRRSWMS